MTNQAKTPNRAELFSAAEKEIIAGDPASPMRLYTVDDPSDLELLHRQSAELPAEEIGGEMFNALCSRMLSTVRDPRSEGVGIAAPQVGISRRVIAVQRFDKPDEPFEIYVNAKITKYGEELDFGSEGCLSVPGRNGEVMRSSRVEISYTDLETRETVREEVCGVTAVIFQHEIDHLDGILYTDRMETGIRLVSYQPDERVCSRHIDIVTEGGIVTDVVIEKGCNGNAKGITALVVGMEVGEVIAKLKGIECKEKGTSCPDQIARALEQLVEEQKPKNTEG